MGVNFPVGKGSGHAVQIVAAEKMDFGISDFSASALAISRDVSAKGSFATSKEPTWNYCPQRSSDSTIPGFAWQMLDFSTADSGWLLFPVFASMKGMNIKKITLVRSEPTARDKLILTKEVGAIISYPTTGVQQLKDEGSNEESIRYAVFGVNALGAGIIGNVKTFEGRPEVVRRLLRATARGFQRSLEDPQETVEVLVK